MWLRILKSSGLRTHFNPWRGCTKVSEGCQYCYAENMSHRNPGVLGVWGKTGTRVVAADAMWREPLKWDRAAGDAGERHRVFCASLADVFEHEDTMPPESLGPVREARAHLFSVIDQTPNLDWLLLTKRPGNVVPVLRRAVDRIHVLYPRGAVFAERWLNVGPPPNVWLGVSAENQARAEERVPLLCQIPARVRFVSAEPLLGPLDLRPWLGTGDNQVSWVIVGGESGSEARPFNTDWARILRDQCGDAGAFCFVKQMGSNPIQLVVKKKGGDLEDIPTDLRVRELPLVQELSQ